MSRYFRFVDWLLLAGIALPDLAVSLVWKRAWKFTRSPRPGRVPRSFPAHYRPRVWTLCENSANPAAKSQCIAPPPRPVPPIGLESRGLTVPQFRRSRRRNMRKDAGIAALWCVLCAALVAIPPPVRAPYPTKPIRLIVPFPPGGPTDTHSRWAGQQLSAAF